MARKPQCLFLRSIPSPRGKWCIVFLGASFLVVSLILALNVDVISLAIPLHEWKIYRIGCIFSSSQTTAHSPEAPQYISHAFHPLVGTGNLMFIYASLWGIAKKNGLTPTIPFTKLHDAFHLDLSPEQFFDLSDCDNYVFGMDECCLYDERTEQIFQRAVGRNVSLWGYFQSSRYFHPEHETDIRRQFAFKENIDVRANDIIKGFRLRSGDSMQVSCLSFCFCTRADVSGNVDVTCHLSRGMRERCATQNRIKVIE
ncbi:hypothetical protein RvY_01753-2 [Ramazzottius varieornatus]|uniref:L-Fucosyltransferase n=1 Tax=Ramazzottius varieornatus TaxID=947166 RepID=A0A1D1UNE4_RAMVA|nr:hypothetical protein RvY_01753-2 [Ramazzottius varieornatus]